MKTRSSLIALMVVSTIGLNAEETTKEEEAYQKVDLSAFLQHFYQNPVEVMDKLPPKTKRLVPLFDQDSQSENQFVEQKDQYRQRFLKLEGRAGIRSNDRAENLVDNSSTMIRSLVEIEAKNLTSASLPKTPWSDDYWAMSKGILGARFADRSFPNTHNWLANYEFAQKNPAENYVLDNRIALLSPSEKYDLLVGDENMTLTKAMWNEGKSYYDRFGKVESWMGICDGWAAASIMQFRPENSIVVKDVTGEFEIPFNPSEMKSLASLMWTKGRYNSNFIGGRCNEKEPQKDLATGRVLDQECFDTNPGTWHLAIVNQIGIAQRSMVMDATFDYEVWNHPVYGYSYRYFNPQTGETAKSFTSAQIEMGDFKRDQFSKYRDSRATKIVGVEMRVEYMTETAPSIRKTDAENYDAINSVTYRYDLELDDNGVIIGGEWYGNAHPDFIWVPVPGEKVRTSFDRALTGSTLEQKLKGATRFAPQSSANGLPLPGIVEALIELSRE